MMPTGYRPKVDFKIPAPPPHDPSSAGPSNTDLRDHFAGLAMQALLSTTKTSDAGMIARDSYKIANAMLEARK